MHHPHYFGLAMFPVFSIVRRVSVKSMVRSLIARAREQADAEAELKRLAAATMRERTTAASRFRQAAGDRGGSDNPAKKLTRLNPFKK
jgi:hypothetical protein